MVGRYSVNQQAVSAQQQESNVEPTSTSESSDDEKHTNNSNSSSNLYLKSVRPTDVERPTLRAKEQPRDKRDSDQRRKSSSHRRSGDFSNKRHSSSSNGSRSVNRRDGERERRKPSRETVEQSVKPPPSRERLTHTKSAEKPSDQTTPDVIKINSVLADDFSSTENELKNLKETTDNESHAEVHKPKPKPRPVRESSPTQPTKKHLIGVTNGDIYYPMKENAPPGYLQTMVPPPYDPLVFTSPMITPRPMSRLFDGSALQMYNPGMYAASLAGTVKGKHGQPMLMIRKDPSDELYRIRPFEYIEIGIRKLLWFLTKAIHRIPWVLFLIPLVITVVCMAGMIAHKKGIAPKLPFESMYAESKFYEDSTHMETRNRDFQSTRPQFSALNTQSLSEFAVLIESEGVTSEGEETSLLREEGLDRNIELRQLVENIRVNTSNTLFNYANLCRHAPKCAPDPILEILSNSKALVFKYPEMKLNGVNKTVYLGGTFGGVKTNSLGNINSAKAMGMFFQMTQDTSQSVNEPLTMWDTKFQAAMRTEQDSNKAFKLSYWSFSGYKIALLDNFKLLYEYMGISVAVFVILFIICCLTMSNYESKPWLGLCGSVGVVLSLITSLSVMVGIHNQLMMLCFPVLYFLAGTGAYFCLDWLQSWRKYSDVAINPVEKIRFVLSIEGPYFVMFVMIAITASGITSVILEIPLLWYSCLLICLALFVLMIYALTMYAAAMYLTGKRELSGVKWYACWFRGDDSYSGTLMKQFKHTELRTLQRKLYNEDNQFAKIVGKILAHAASKYLCIILFCVYLVFSVWGCTMLEPGVREEDYIDQNSNFYTFLTSYKRLFGPMNQYIEVEFMEPINYFDEHNYEGITNLFRSGLRSGDFENALSFIKDFFEFERYSKFEVDRSTFMPVLANIFLKDPRYSHFASDVILDAYNERILKSRMFAQLSNAGVSNVYDIVKNMEEVGAAYELPIKIKAPLIFLTPAVSQAKFSALMALCVCTLICTVLSLIILAQPFATMILFFTYASIMVGTLGYAALWGVQLNAVTTITCLSGMIYTTCICSACCFHFMNNKLANGRQRIQYMFASMFRPMISSALIIIISYFPLMVTNSTLVYDVAKLIFVHVMVTFLHSFIFLPPSLLLLTVDVPACMQGCKQVCSCAACCGPDEETESIYFFPTGVRPISPEGSIALPLRYSVAATPLPAITPSYAGPVVLRPDFLPQEVPIIEEAVSRGPTPHTHRYSSLSRPVDKDEVLQRTRHYRSVRDPGARVRSRSVHPDDLMSDYHRSGGRGSAIPTITVPDSDVQTDVETDHDRRKNRSPRRSGASTTDHRMEERSRSHTAPRNQMSYARWSRDVPTDQYGRPTRITAEKYTFCVPTAAQQEVRPQWSDAWLRGNVRDRPAEQQKYPQMSMPPPSYMGQPPHGTQRGYPVPPHPDLIRASVRKSKRSRRSVIDGRF